MIRNPQLYQLNQSPFYKLRTRRKLACILKLKELELRLLTAKGDALYREFDVAKKKGGIRHVENPARPLKLVQARIARLLSRIKPPDYLLCPVKGRSYISNATKHKDNRVIKCLDIRKYYPSTLSRRVYWFFRSVMQCEPDIAGILTKLASYEGHLPTGSPLSPIMSYFAHFDVWEAAARIANKNDCILTVYIDDVTVSGSKVRAGVLWEIKKAIHRAGLRYHKEKAYFDRASEVTGVIIRDGKLFPPNRQRRKLKDAKKALLLPLPSTDQKELFGKMRGLKGQIDQIAAANDLPCPNA